MSDHKFTRRLFIGGMLVTVSALHLNGCSNPKTKLVEIEQSGQYFTADELTLLNDVAEIMIPRTDTPGAMDARVAAVIDAMMLTWANEPTRHLFRAALQKVEGVAKVKLRKPYASLKLKQRENLITEMDFLSFSENTPHYALGYKRLKDLIFRVFYASEAANADYVPIPGQYRGNLTLSEYETLMETYSYGG